MTLEAFEALVLSQQPATQAWTPVTDYREAARREAEGRHPALILETFQPTAIHDVGCGFNYLARFINEVAGRRVAYGSDRDNPAADLQFDVTRPLRPDARTIMADLVICREVLEHLPVLQIRRAVTNLCALTTRFVYVTTRFHPNPSSLLDIATADDLDPTHISMLNKDLLRLLFVLEGFRRRKDLEAKLDWQRKARCLVYERAV